MFEVNVDRADQTALHHQVAAEIRRAISDGEAAPGDRLPPAKDFAAELGVNTNTVLRALRTLRDEVQAIGVASQTIRSKATRNNEDLQENA